MEYRVDFNRIRKLQSVGVGGDNLFNLIRASVLPIKFLSRSFYIQISYVQPDKVTNLVGWCQGLFLICYGFIDRLSLYYFVSKELLQFFYLLYEFIYFYNCWNTGIDKGNGIVGSHSSYVIYARRVYILTLHCRIEP